MMRVSRVSMVTDLGKGACFISCCCQQFGIPFLSVLRHNKHTVTDKNGTLVLCYSNRKHKYSFPWSSLFPQIRSKYKSTTFLSIRPVSQVQCWKIQIMALLFINCVQAVHTSYSGLSVTRLRCQPLIPGIVVSGLKWGYK